MEVGVGQAELQAHSRQHSKLSALPSYAEFMTIRNSNNNNNASRRSSGHTERYNKNSEILEKLQIF